MDSQGFDIVQYSLIQYLFEFGHYLFERTIFILVFVFLIIDDNKQFLSVLFFNQSKQLCQK